RTDQFRSDRAGDPGRCSPKSTARQIAKWLESSGKTGNAPDGNDVLVLAETYGVLPDVVEREMSEYWRLRAIARLEGMAINAENASRANRRR
ncbi:MAG: hypothetical protein ACRD43_05545, partial [Pyrinomonadaceae bacterium]